MMNSMGGEKAKDLFEARYVVLGSFGISLLVVMIYIWMMDKFAVYLAWISVAYPGISHSCRMGCLALKKQVPV